MGTLPTHEGCRVLNLTDQLVAQLLVDARLFDLTGVFSSLIL